MADISPIRVWITGGTLDDREQVLSVLRDQPLAVVEGEDAGLGDSHLRAAAQLAGKTKTADQETIEKAVRESQRLISIGRLSAEIVHEINNPLESVGNLLYLALHEPGMPEGALRFLQSAESELQRVVQISKQTLSFSRESAKPVPVHLPDLMEEVTSMYGRRTRQKGLRLIEDYISSRTIVAVPGEIRQVFSNLVTNAIEASANGGRLRIRIRDARNHGASDGVRITVCDNGVGIDEAARKRIGEIFFTTKGESGTGLGLWVTKAIVARYDGVMQLRSSTGDRHGTAFSIFFPSHDPGHGRSQDQGKIQTRKPQAAGPLSGKVTEISRHPRHATHTHAVAQSGDDRPDTDTDGTQVKARSRIR